MTGQTPDDAARAVARAARRYRVDRRGRDYCVVDTKFEKISMEGTPWGAQSWADLQNGRLAIAEYKAAIRARKI